MSNDFIKLRCTNCLTLNRVEASRLDHEPRCGNCKTVLTVPRQPVFARQDAFDRDVSYWPETLVVTFTSNSCIYCRISDPLMSELMVKHPGKLKVMKVDFDHDALLVERFKVTKTPSYLVYKAGEFVIRMDGPFREKAELGQWIENLISYTSY